VWSKTVGLPVVGRFKNPSSTSANRSEAEMDCQEGSPARGGTTCHQINDSDRASWTRAIETLDERNTTLAKSTSSPKTANPHPISPIPHSNFVSTALNTPARANGADAGSPWNSGTDSTSTPSGNPASSLPAKTPMAQSAQNPFITPEGLPIGYEVMRGNTSDKTTLRGILEKITGRYGKEQRTWIMDRGIPTEAVLEEMRQDNPSVRYPVGTPKGRLTKLEKDLSGKEWQEVKDDVLVKLLPCDGELYVLARSLPRRSKESAMKVSAISKATLAYARSSTSLTNESRPTYS